jgi:hypothetical protein
MVPIVSQVHLLRNSDVSQLSQTNFAFKISKDLFYINALGKLHVYSKIP